MTNNVPSLMVAVADHAAIVKVNGRANFATSVTFKRLVGELTQRGFEQVILDLTECVTMDSTFLGVLAGTALKFAETHRNTHDGHRGCHLRLLNPNQRVADLLENLGVAELFTTIHSNTPVADGQTMTPAEETNPSRVELSQACLEAHQTLMDINPDNVPRFKEVTQFLAEDIKKLTAESAKAATS
jgi:anti-sigma B factor antagonist